MNKWIKIAVVVAAAGLVSTLLVHRPEPKLERGRPAPPLALRDVGGREVNLSSLRGRVVAVNFWATWCGPCAMEMPELAEAWRENRDRCFDIVGVAEESATEDVRRVSKQVPYPLVVDERATALGPWGVQGYPMTFLVDADGNVRQVFQGALQKRELEEAIRPLLPKTCPARS